MKTLFKTTLFIALGFITLNTGHALEYSQTLARGDVGESVTELQECLLNMEYELPEYGADGSFGMETYLAVVEYQEKYELTVDGVVGRQTADHMTCKSPRERDLADIEDVTFDSEETGVIVTVSGVAENTCNVVDDSIGISFVSEENHFALSVTQTLPYEDEVCEEVENEYSLKARINTINLEAGEYTIEVNEDNDFDYLFEIEEKTVNELAVEEPTNESQEQVVNNTSASTVSSSYRTDVRDTAVFNFKMNLTPFEDPIYVPAVADASADIEVYASDDEPIDHVYYDLTVRSDAEKVTGVDGNVYYRVKEPEVFIYTATAQPGEGEYYGRLVNISFTTQNVMDKEYAGFTGLTLEVEPETWTTEVVELRA